MRKTKIVCTIGPASSSLEILKELMHTGMNVARLNFSHGNYEEHQARIEMIRLASLQTGTAISILLDIKGPKIRTHEFEGGQARLNDGATVMVSMKKVLGTSERFSITYEGLYDDVTVGTHLLLDDGLLELEVREKENGELKTKVIHGGILKDHKGINVPNVNIRLPGVTEKDIQDIKFGISQHIDYIAASYIRNASDVLTIKHILHEHHAAHIRVIPKIENKQGITNIDSILEIADGLMVARGDMGIEMPTEEVPLIQKMLIQKCNAVGKPVIVATQMLDSMQKQPRPTRAEASDVANAVLDGSDAIMLSGETAAGLYPVQSVQTMHRIASSIEKSLNYEELQRSRMQYPYSSLITEAIGQSVSHTSLSLPITAILAPTRSGYTARTISKYRPKAPIIAITSDETVYRQLSLVWGVTAFLTKQVATTDEMIQHAVETAKTASLVSPNDTIIITAGVPVQKVGTTNMMKIQTV